MVWRFLRSGDLCDWDSERFVEEWERKGDGKDVEGRKGTTNGMVRREEEEETKVSIS